MASMPIPGPDSTGHQWFDRRQGPTGPSTSTLSEGAGIILYTLTPWHHPWPFLGSTMAVPARSCLGQGSVSRNFGQNPIRSTVRQAPWGPGVDGIRLHFAWELMAYQATRFLRCPCWPVPILVNTCLEKIVFGVPEAIQVMLLFVG